MTFSKDSGVGQERGKLSSRGGLLRVRKNVWNIVLVYALVAGLWIFFSDRLLATLVAKPEMRLEWSILKGLLFVVVTAAMLYVLIARLTSRLWRMSASWAASEQKFRALFEEVTDGIVVVELATKRFYLGNHAFSRMLGYDEEEIRHLTVFDIHPQEALACVTEQFVNQALGRETIASSIPVKRKDGSVFFADINATGIDLEGRRYVIGVFRDVTDHKRVECDLKQAKEAAETANRAKDRFIAVLSHELRTPLTPALATVSALQGQHDLPVEMWNDLDVVRRNLELESRLIDDLLDVTRISRGKIKLQLESTNLHDCLKRALEICRSEIDAKHIGIALYLEAASYGVRADSARLQQVFWNLLRNATKFTPEGGKITLRSANIGNRIRIEIADTGIGIEPEAMERIFHPFEQGEQTQNRRFGGLGLGLSIAQHLVELHQGFLSATSEGHNKGAVFFVELPMDSAFAAASTPVPVPTPPSGRVHRILLVEDHADTLHILSRLLRKWNYAVEAASSVRGALELASKQSFDLLISDLGLPDGTGQEIMVHVKEHYGLRGIALSGFGADEDLQSSRAAGFEEHFVKPVNFLVLQAALQRLLRERILS